MNNFRIGTKNNDYKKERTLATNFCLEKILIPLAAIVDSIYVPRRLFTKFQLSFYSSLKNVAKKSLGIE